MSTLVNSNRKHHYKCPSNARKPKVRQNLKNDPKVVCLDPLWHFQDTCFSTIKTPASKGLRFKTVLVFELKVHWSCTSQEKHDFASQNCSKVVQIWGLDAKMNTFLNIWTCDARPHFQEFEASWQRYELRTKTVILTFFDRRLWVDVSKHTISITFQIYQRGRIFHACPRRAILAVCGPA